MKWTKERPTKPGWYWVHLVGHKNPVVLDLVISDLFKRSGALIDYAGRSLSHQYYRRAKWSGPIQEPGDE